ncbi:MAG: glycosyltransferase [Blautia sp.]
MRKETLENCLESIKKNTLYDNYDIIIVENNSTTDEIFEYYKKLSKDPRIHLICWKKSLIILRSTILA